MSGMVRLAAVLALLAVAAWGAWNLSHRGRAPLPPRPEVTIRIGEGQTLAQLATQLASQRLEAVDSSIAYWRSVPDGLATATAVFLARAKPASVDLEGYLFPDTYRVWADDALVGLTAKALAETAKVVGEELAAPGADPGGLNVHQVLTLASIIEREVPSDLDRAKVADVFRKRLAVGMALQSDATVNYVTGKSTDRPSSADLDTDSRYNTYRYPGLPPGPIGEPSRSAIHAVLHPTPNPYYFFLTTPDGQVIYSKTGAEHSEAKARYLR